MKERITDGDNGDRMEVEKKGDWMGNVQWYGLTSTVKCTGVPSAAKSSIVFPVGS